MYISQFLKKRKKKTQETSQNLKCLLRSKQARGSQDSTLRNPNKEESDSPIALIGFRVHKLWPLEEIDNTASD